MNPPLYMLDTNICSFLMRGRPEVLRHLTRAEASSAVITVSAIVYSELRDAALGPHAAPEHARMVSDFIERLDGVLPWDKAAAEQTSLIRQQLRRAGIPIGPNDSAIAGHAVAVGAVLITNNTREFARVPDLVIEDWTIGMIDDVDQAVDQDQPPPISVVP